MTSRANLIRKIRRCIGKGKSEVGRGATWMFFHKPTWVVAKLMARKFGPANITRETRRRGKPAKTYQIAIHKWTLEGWEVSLVIGDDRQWLTVSYLTKRNGRWYCFDEAV